MGAGGGGLLSFLFWVSFFFFIRVDLQYGVKFSCTEE